MANKTYSFVEQLEKGELYEKILDRYFSQWYDVWEVGMSEQKKGIDRTFRRKGMTDALGQRVEYKADDKTQTTGNVFIETWSSVEWERYGWAWTSTADILIYLAIPDTIYIVEPVEIRVMIPEWERKYGLKLVKNKTYHSGGIPVPEAEFAKICKTIRRLT